MTQYAIRNTHSHRDDHNRHQQHAKGAVGEFGPGLQDEEEAEHEAIVRSRDGRAQAADQIERDEGQPLRGGDVELAQSDVEEFGRGEGVEEGGDEGGEAKVGGWRSKVNVLRVACCGLRVSPRLATCHLPPATCFLPATPTPTNTRRSRR